MVLNGCLNGLYIAQLMFDNGDNTHTVGIDTNQGIIFDCMEPFGMHLNKNNLDYCSGSDMASIVSIPYMYEIEKSGKKRKSK